MPVRMVLVFKSDFRSRCRLLHYLLRLSLLQHRQNPSFSRLLIYCQNRLLLHHLGNSLYLFSLGTLRRLAMDRLSIIAQPRSTMFHQQVWEFDQLQIHLAKVHLNQQFQPLSYFSWNLKIYLTSEDFWCSTFQAFSSFLCALGRLGQNGSLGGTGGWVPWDPSGGYHGIPG